MSLKERLEVAGVTCVLIAPPVLSSPEIGPALNEDEFFKAAAFSKQVVYCDLSDLDFSDQEKNTFLANHPNFPASAFLPATTPDGYPRLGRWTLDREKYITNFAGLLVWVIVEGE